jgi:divalent metal cation (Fe/Co/Zn/Cd) transporter
LFGLGATVLIQVVIVWLSGSVALLADTIHNVGDAATAVPLWIAFVLARRPPSPRFTYLSSQKWSLRQTIFRLK